MTTERDQILREMVDEEMTRPVYIPPQKVVTMVSDAIKAKLNRIMGRVD